MKKTTMGGVVILAVMLAGTGAELAAQQARGPGARAEARMDRTERMGRTARGGGAPGIEGILRMRDRLALTEEQVSRLDALRSERVRDRTEVSAEMAEVRSRLRAGSLSRAEAREGMRAAAEARRANAEQARAEVDSLLTDDQRATLQQLQSRRRAFEAGRRSVLRERARGGRPQRDRPIRDRGWRGPGGAF